MQFKQKIKPEFRMQFFTALGPIACLALVLSIFLGSLDNPNLEIVTGFMVGFSIVGNLGYIFVVTRYLIDNRRQK